MPSRIRLYFAGIMLTVATLNCVAATPNTVQEVKFEGIIEHIDTGCDSDGVCYMDISGRKVVYGRGWSHSPWGHIEGFEALNVDPLTAKVPPQDVANFMNKSRSQFNGKKVSVYGRKEGKEYSLEGSEKYYIKLK